MIGREARKENDLFFTCSLIEYIGRKTKNYRSDVVTSLGKANLEKIYELADIYHSDNIDRVSEDFILQAGITEGCFDNIANAKYSIPSHWDIGKVYKRLISGVSDILSIPVIEALQQVYASFICEKIDDYNSSFYYEAPQCILQAFLGGRIDYIS